MNTAIRIRPYCPEDASVIVSFTELSVEQRYFSSGVQRQLVPQAFSEEMKKRLMPVMLIADGVPVGHDSFIDIGDVCTVGSLIVHTSHRGGRYAQFLLQSLENITRMYGASRLDILCKSKNFKARVFFFRR